MPSRMLVRGFVRLAVENRRMPSVRASRRPVAGTICISPHALAEDLMSGSNVDSWLISAAMT